jgi:hypothetical protein
MLSRRFDATGIMSLLKGSPVLRSASAGGWTVLPGRSGMVDGSENR